MPRGFVHRDVKPANLLFDDDRRRLCVADFGLARALAEAAWTEPVGATLGTARYAAPEQAQGRRVDGRADVYALALVLFEALTGSVPFSTDTTIGTLMARVGAELPAHDSLFPLDEVLRAAAAPEPDDRLSAAELARWLSEAARELPTPASLPEGRHKAWRPYDDITEMGASSASSAPGPAAPGAGGASGAASAVIESSPDAGADAMALASAIGVADAASETDVTANRTAASTNGHSSDSHQGGWSCNRCTCHPSPSATPRGPARSACQGRPDRNRCTEPECEHRLRRDREGSRGPVHAASQVALGPRARGHPARRCGGRWTCRSKALRGVRPRATRCRASIT